VDAQGSGKRFHSGLPHKGINALELASEAVAELQRRFYTEFGPHEKEAAYNFLTPSTMKPTLIKNAPGSLNQLPPWTEISGDVRLTPFYEPKALQAFLEAAVADMNKNITKLPTRGPCSKYEIEGARGLLEITVSSNEVLSGIACTLDSVGHKALMAATTAVLGSSTCTQLAAACRLCATCSGADSTCSLLVWSDEDVPRGQRVLPALGYGEGLPHLARSHRRG